MTGVVIMFQDIVASKGSANTFQREWGIYLLDAASKPLSICN